jgi:hypothetical protein
MLIAFSFPLGIFFVLPFGVLLALTPLTAAGLVEAGLFVLAVAAPIYATGFLLAPWAGRHVGATKVPAFAMSLVAALASALIVGGMASGGSVELGALMAGIVAMFAVPGSVIAALLFIGGCTRLLAETRQA